MPALNKTLRNSLDATINRARDVAEKGARAVLEAYAVGEPSPFAHMTEQECQLRRKLRAHGRQLGDSFNGQTAHMDRLVEEVAYEHWHRMLFARFLAENDLLMYPDPESPVAVTLEECQELCDDGEGEGARNGFELAARYASQMLPQIFRRESPILQLSFAPEYGQALEKLVDSLSREVFTASDSLGWVYQFWQTETKKRINNAEVKIGDRELPAVTQLFTEEYMVQFLLDNSLGAWWAGHILSAEDWRTASSETELRQKLSDSVQGELDFRYVRFVQENGVWQPAAGTFAAWPKDFAHSFKQLKLLDPCCGSGHFLVAVLHMLAPMRKALEGLNTRDAVDAVLRDNIHGLELDARCVALAAFALALSAWKYPDAGGYRSLPEIHVACSGLSVTADKRTWTSLAKPQTKLRNALDVLYDDFQDAPILGSLLNPSASLAANLVDIAELSPMLQQSLSTEERGEDGGDIGKRAAHSEAAVVAQGLAKTAHLLAQEYTLVMTNVPYLKGDKQSEVLRNFCETHYDAAKQDLATVFLERCLQLCAVGGTACIVLPQNWLFLTTYTKFRTQLLKQHTWHMVARLGSGAFETISGEVVKAILLTMSRGANTFSGGLFGDAPKQILRGLDVSLSNRAEGKDAALQVDTIQSVEQAKQLENPDARVAFEEVQGELLEKCATSYKGITTGDDLRYKYTFWEFSNFPEGFTYFQSTVKGSMDFGGCESIINYKTMTQPMQSGVYIRALNALQEQGVMVSQMSKLPSAQYLGTQFDTNAGAIIPKKLDHLPAIWCYCSSPEYNEAVRQIDQSLKVTNATLAKVPFDLERWQKVAEEQYPNGLPKPYSDDPTQWIFHGYPCGATMWDVKSKQVAPATLRTDSTVLQVAVARLLGYRWPAELDEAMELDEKQRSWVKQCQNLASLADSDGIVCLPPMRGERSAADRLVDMLAKSYGSAWSTDMLAELLNNAGYAGKSLDTWLENAFFSQHCKLFQHRPFIWHIWDGLCGGFSALVNYHKLDHKNLENLTYAYLGDWITKQKDGINNGIDGSSERLAAAENLKKSLELILKGEDPYDIFVRWKKLEEQSIGWHPDLNDGVRLNIRPFLTVPDVKKSGAGILRDKPNIQWKKDRGKDVESAPWFSVFNGDRENDHHLTLAEKECVRR